MILNSFIVEITEDERIKSFKKYEVERQRIKDSIAFGRRAEEQITDDAMSISGPVSCFRSDHSLCKYNCLFSAE